MWPAGVRVKYITLYTSLSWFRGPNCIFPGVRICQGLFAFNTITAIWVTSLAHICPSALSHFMSFASNSVIVFCCRILQFMCDRMKVLPKAQIFRPRIVKTAITSWRLKVVREVVYSGKTQKFVSPFTHGPNRKWQPTLAKYSTGEKEHNKILHSCLES